MPRGLKIPAILGVMLLMAFGLISVPKTAASSRTDVYDIVKRSTDRDQAIRELRSASKARDPQVKVLVIEHLLALGDHSHAGILSAMIANEGNGINLRITCARLLERYGVKIPYDQLHELHEISHDADLVRIMAMQENAGATDLIQKLKTSGKAGGSYYYLAFTDISGSAEQQALATFNRDTDDEYVAAAIYLFIQTGKKEYLRQAIASITAEKPYSKFLKPEVAAFDHDGFRLLLSIQSDEVRDFARGMLENQNPEISTTALVSLHCVQKDHAFLDEVLQKRLHKPPPTSGFYERAFWRIAFRRSAANANIASLLEAQASREIHGVYGGLDARFVDEYWTGKYLPYRPVRFR